MKLNGHKPAAPKPRRFVVILHGGPVFRFDAPHRAEAVRTVKNVIPAAWWTKCTLEESRT